MQIWCHDRWRFRLKSSLPQGAGKTCHGAKTRRDAERIAKSNQEQQAIFRHRHFQGTAGFKENKPLILFQKTESAVLVEFISQGADTDPQHLGGMCPIIVGFMEGL